MAKKRQKTAKRKRYSQRLATELTSLERDLMRALQERLERARSVSAHDAVEFMDMVTDSEIDDLAARLAESDAGKIEEIEEALRLLREGEYGKCQICGRTIAKKRLDARPFATQCINCKRRVERAATGGGGDLSRETEVDVDVGGREREENDVAFDELFRDVKTGDVY